MTAAEARQAEVKVSNRRRLISTLLLVSLIVGLIWSLDRRRPVELEVSYDLSGAGRRSLRHLHVDWRDDEGETALSADFGFGPGGAPRAKAHDVSLPRGAYTLDVLLEYDEGYSRTLERRVDVDEEGSLGVNLQP